MGLEALSSTMMSTMVEPATITCTSSSPFGWRSQAASAGKFCAIDVAVAKRRQRRERAGALCARPRSSPAGAPAASAVFASVRLEVEDRGHPCSPIPGGSMVARRGVATIVVHSRENCSSRSCITARLIIRASAGPRHRWADDPSAAALRSSVVTPSGAFEPMPNPLRDDRDHSGGELQRLRPVLRTSGAGSRQPSTMWTSSSPLRCRSQPPLPANLLAKMAPSR